MLTKVSFPCPVVLSLFHSHSHILIYSFAFQFLEFRTKRDIPATIEAEQKIMGAAYCLKTVVVLSKLSPTSCRIPNPIITVATPRGDPSSGDLKFRDFLFLIVLLSFVLVEGRCFANERGTSDTDAPVESVLVLADETGDRLVVLVSHNCLIVLRKVKASHCRFASSIVIVIMMIKTNDRRQQNLLFSWIMVPE